MLREAIELHRQGRLEEAETAYRAALQGNPNDGEALRGLGAVRRMRGDLAESAALISRAHVLAPEQPKLLMMLGAVQFELGNADASRDAYERVLALDPNTAGAHTALGHIAMMQGNPTLAEQYFRTAMRVNEDPQALAGLGTLALDRDDPETAIKYLTRASDLAPKDAGIAYALGRGFAKRGMIAFAEQAFRNALRLRPGQPNATSALGQLLVQEKRPGEAEPYFRSLLGKRGFDLVAELGMGDVARQQERFEEAVESYKRALALKPDHALAFETLIACLGKLGRGSDILQLLNQRLGEHPEQDRWRVMRARVFEAGGRIGEAIADWKWLHDKHPQNGEAVAELARAHELNGDLDLAASLAESAATLNLDNPALTVVRVRALMRKGENERARELLAGISLSQVEQNLSRTCMNLYGHLHDRAGQMVEACDYFRESQNALPLVLPSLDPLPENFEAELARVDGQAWSQAPILLVGAPGSGVERIAALLAEQPGFNVLRDRVQGVRNDCFDGAAVDLSADSMPEADAAAHRETYQASLRARGLDLDKPLIDWIPRFDARYLLVARHVMPGTRIIIVDADPREAMLNWLAFGWLPFAGMSDFDNCVDWLARATAHLRFAANQNVVPSIVVDAEKVMADPAKAGADLARFLGLETLKAGSLSKSFESGLGGMPARFAKNHWQAYAEALAEPFAKLPV